ncbi:putative ubiquitin carboxyl-terminal hydrolase [Hamiltosporidium tvaerminnensis]|uniref:Putative ubiquitin carboxyl-terminal hydrolase n=1 Tax=Hamiltosporidium tvaerminnensis TaxID=1176355 RepID=A0A4Q9L7A0_9MICR|nr:putative ubiquitin carboxyl-terminal hydrolase [Hamiltosporidium tvaerminnensis]
MRPKNLIISFITTVVIFSLGFISGVIFNELYSIAQSKNVEKNQFVESEICEFDINISNVKRIIREKNICRLKNESRVICYFNTLMKCMFATKIISDFYLENVEKNDVTQTIKELFLQMKKNKEVDTAEKLLKIRNNLGTKEFSNLKQQQDIQALYTALVSACLPKNLNFNIIKNPISYVDAALLFREIPNDNLSEIEIVNEIIRHSKVFVIHSRSCSNKFNERLKICKELIIDENYKNELISFGCHRGTLQSGHYVAVIKLDENIWAVISDDDVKYFNWCNIHNYLDYYEYKPVLFFFQIIS